MEFMLNTQQIDAIVSIALEAGEIAVKYKQNRDFEINFKDDGSEVTTADLKVSEFLHYNLTAILPDIPIICEEGRLRKIKGKTFWLIDPIDGTRAFVKGSDEFAVNIGLIHDSKPIFGLINAPEFKGGMLGYSGDNQVTLINCGQKTILTKNEFNCDNLRNRKILKIVTSKRTSELELKNYLTWHQERLGATAARDDTISNKLSSAVKFFYLLTKEADLYLHFSKTMEWDIAAGHAIINSLGGKIKTLTTSPKLALGDGMTYQKTNFDNPPFISFICNPWNNETP